MGRGLLQLSVWACALAVFATGARASLTLNTGAQVATHAGNLVTNGSFETGAPAPGSANFVYWATGTTNLPFAVPAGWISSGQPQTYAFWGSDGPGLGVNFSAALPDGAAGLYFGNGLTAIDKTPTHNPDGTAFPRRPPSRRPTAAPRRFHKSSIPSCSPPRATS